jgi:hypothetical protein
VSSQLRDRHGLRTLRAEADIPLKAADRIDTSSCLLAVVVPLIWLGAWAAIVGDFRFARFVWSWLLSR